MLITRLTAFSEALNWQKRRQVLFDLLDTRSDGELMALDERFKPLSDMLGKLCIDDFKRKLTSSRKQYSEEKNVLPKRIDEVTTIVRGLREEDYETLRSRLASVSEKRTPCRQSLLNLTIIQQSPRSGMSSHTSEMSLLLSKTGTVNTERTRLSQSKHRSTNCIP